MAGGALFCSDGATVALRDAAFVRNAALLGGAMSVGSADDGAAAGGCTVDASALTCAANRAPPHPLCSHGGGCAFVTAGSSVGVRASSIVDNRAGDDVGDGGDGGGGGCCGGATGRAGALLVAGAAEVNGSLIARNAAARGGAVVVAAAALGGGGAATLRECNVSANAAAVDGGAAYVAAGTLRAMSTDWEDNVAGGGGGERL